jgi:hypothetical protein
MLIVLHVVCVTLTDVFLNNFMINFVSFPKYVKWTHFLSCVDLSRWVGVLGVCVGRWSRNCCFAVFGV